MNFVLKGKVNYLPVETNRKLKNNFAEVDMNYEISPKKPENYELVKGVKILTSGEEFETLLKTAEVVETGMEAMHLDSKIGGDSLEDENRRHREVKHAPSSGLVRKAMDEAGVPVKLMVVEKGAKVAEHLRFYYDTKNGNLVENQVIYAKEDSDLTIIEIFQSEDEKDSLLGVRTRVYVEENARVKMVRINLLGNKTTHFDDMGFHVLHNGTAELVELELGGFKNYSAFRSELVGVNSGFLSDVGYLCRGKSLLDLNFVANLWGKKAHTNMDTSGVLMDEATKVYRGSIDFKEGAKNSSGFETENTIHFSPKVINKSVPLILCHEHEVEGDHGATIGRLDEKLLFYINSRGIDRESAKELMTMARINAVTNKIVDEEAEELVREYVRGVFGNGN